MPAKERVAKGSTGEPDLGSSSSSSSSSGLSVDEIEVLKATCQAGVAIKPHLNCKGLVPMECKEGWTKVVRKSLAQSLLAWVASRPSITPLVGIPQVSQVDPTRATVGKALPLQKLYA